MNQRNRLLDQRKNLLDQRKKKLKQRDNSFISYCLIMSIIWFSLYLILFLFERYYD